MNKSAPPPLTSPWHSKTDWNIAISFQNITRRLSGYSA